MTSGAVLVVGSGLLGTSLGLALRGRREVRLTDTDPDVLSQSVALGAGEAWDGRTPVELAVLCTPLPALAPALLGLQRAGLARTCTHVGSVQSAPLRALEALGADTTTVCGGHPMAGKETSGPGAASAALFDGRPWFVCPGPRTLPTAVEAVSALAEQVGAQPVETTPEEHDRTVALVSHLPQVAASTVAAQLLGRPGAAAFAGPGLVDTTRLAGSPVGMWEQVLSANAGEVAPLLRAVAHELTALAGELEAGGDLARTRDLLERGRAGRALVPVKRGRTDGDLVVVRVELPDRPGRLAEVLTVAARAEVNVEDLRVDHLPGREQGTLELRVAAAARPGLVGALQQAGLRVQA